MKKKNQRGFTLVELMGVILILGIVLLIAIPAVTKFLGKSKDQYYETTIDNIESATEEFLMDYNELVPPTQDGGIVYETSVTEFYLKNLVDLKYLDSVEDPNTHASCDEESYVVVTNTGYDAQYSSDGEALQGANQNLEIDVCLKCGDETINDHNSKCSTVQKHYAFVDNNTEEPLSTVKFNAGNYYPLVKDLVNNNTFSITNLYSTNEEMATTSSRYITTKNKEGKVLIYGTYRLSTKVSSYSYSYSYYILPLLIEVTGNTILPERITTEKDSITVYTSSNTSTFFNIYPFNAATGVRCSIVNKDENGNVYTPSNKTYSGSASSVTTNVGGGKSCGLKNFKFTSYTTATKETTDTYLRIQSTNAEEVYVDVPIYNYYG